MENNEERTVSTEEIIQAGESGSQVQKIGIVESRH